MAHLLGVFCFAIPNGRGGGGPERSLTPRCVRGFPEKGSFNPEPGQVPEITLVLRPSGEVRQGPRRVLFKGSLATLCLLVASLPQPRKQAWKALLRQRGCYDKVHHRLASESAQPACDIGRPGPIVRSKREEYRVASPQSNGLGQVGEAERFGRLARENGTQTISAMSAHDPRSEGAHTHVRYSRILDGRGRVTNRVDLGMGDRTQKGIDKHLIALIDRQASFPYLRLYHKARRPDAQGAFELAPLVEDHTLRTHGSHRALIDDLDAQAHQSPPDGVGHALVPGASERPPASPG